MDDVKNFLYSLACYTDKYHDYCKQEEEAPFVVISIVIVVVIAIMGLFIKPYIETRIKEWREKEHVQEDVSDLIPDMLEIIKYAVVNRNELSKMTPRERQIQLQYWEKLLRHAKSTKELLDIRDSLIHRFTPAPELAWRFDY